MRTKRLIVALGAGVLLIYAVTSGGGASVSAQPHDCNVSKVFGAFRTVTAESWLLFEDEGGTLRAVDYGCHVQRVFNRK
jgi:hypothetical protein